MYLKTFVMPRLQKVLSYQSRIFHMKALLPNKDLSRIRGCHPYLSLQQSLAVLLTATPWHSDASRRTKPVSGAQNMAAGGKRRVASTGGVTLTKGHQGSWLLGVIRLWSQQKPMLTIPWKKKSSGKTITFSDNCKFSKTSCLRQSCKQ